VKRIFPTVADLDVDFESSYDADRPAHPQRPFVLVNMVTSVDAAFAEDGRTDGLSSPADQEVFHLLRGIPDAILVGAQTLRAEHYGPPRLSEDRQARRVARGQQPQPTIVVVTRSLQLDLSSTLFTESRPIVICPTDVAAADLAAVGAVADVVQAGEGDVDLADALAELRRRGVEVLLCEGGPTLNGDLARHGLIDELCLTIAPTLVGGDLGTGILGRVRLEAPVKLELAQVLLADGGDLLCRYTVAASADQDTAAALVAHANRDAEQTFNAVMGQLDMPMHIVTAAADDERGGCLVGFAAQCSIEPPRFMVWLSKKNHTLTIARRAEVLGVHFPAADQVELAARFGTRSGDHVDKLATERWREGPGGVPILDEVPRWFAGRITERFDAGDHIAFMLEPIAASVGDPLPQLGFQHVKHFNAGHEA
jgi:riboflavin-specific deaminase-like protein